MLVHPDASTIITLNVQILWVFIKFSRCRSVAIRGSVELLTQLRAYEVVGIGYYDQKVGMDCAKSRGGTYEAL